MAHRSEVILLILPCLQGMWSLSDHTGAFNVLFHPRIIVHNGVLWLKFETHWQHLMTPHCWLCQYPNLLVLQNCLHAFFCWEWSTSFYTGSYGLYGDFGFQNKPIPNPIRPSLIPSSPLCVPASGEAWLRPSHRVRHSLCVSVCLLTSVTLSLPYLTVTMHRGCNFGNVKHKNKTTTY